MKKFTLALFLPFLCLQINAQDVYEDALTAASYAYSHSKRAHGANNVYHTQEYADKAVEAFEKVEQLADKCGCEDANEMAYEAKSNMVNALEEDTFERSRFYAKQAKELGPQILEKLTNCQDGVGNDYAGDIASNEEEELMLASKEVLKKQKELEAQKRNLEIEQQKLEEQIALQQKVKAKFEQQRADELEAQAIVKTKAELALRKLEDALKELSIAFDDGSIELEKDYVRNESDLKNETLNDTKTFYVNRAKELTQSAMQQFATYTSEEEN